MNAPEKTSDVPYRTVADVVAAVERGDRPRFHYFWGASPVHPGRVDCSCLSQWFAAPFTVDGETFATGEHYMMAAKAALFDDRETRARILQASSPGQAKALGRTVRGFDETRWSAERWEIVVATGVHRFAEHAGPLAYLLASGDRVLVEASPHDRVWGIGIGKAEAVRVGPSGWRGQNLLGFALMETRRRLAKHR